MKSNKNIVRWLSLILVTVVILQLLQTVGANHVYANENNSNDSTDIKNNSIQSVQGTKDLYYSYPYLREIKYHLTPDSYKKDKLNSQNGNSITIGDYKSVLAEKIIENSANNNQNENVSTEHLSSIGGKVWHDVNGDGIQEDSETLIEGIDVYLLDENKNIINSTKTDAFGRYEFDDLHAGNYYVKINVFNEFKLFTKKQGTNDTNLDNDFDKNGFTSKIEIKDKVANCSIDAGMTKPITIGDFVWNDINWNGKQDEGEYGISGILVKLYKDGQLILNKTTDSDGHYLFTNLSPGEYSLEFVDLKGIYIPTSNISSSNIIDDNNFTKIYTLLSGDEKKHMDVAFHKAKIKSRIFEDKNFNGIQDGNEPGIGDVIVKLYLENGTLIKETRTNSLGIYEFNNLLPGKYYIKVEKPKGYNYFSPKKSEEFLRSSIVNKKGVSDVFTISKGQNYIYLNAGITFFGEVKAKVFEDKNYNGRRDQDDKPIEGTRVKLLSANGDEVKDIYGNYVEDQITDEYGRVYFKNLPKGEYKINAVMPKGYSSFTKQSTDISSNFSNVNTGGYSENIDVKKLNEDDVIDVGVIRSGSIGSTVWYDNNKDGKQNKDEEGVEGIDVFLCDSNGKLLAVTNTDKNGKYRFDNLDPGKYYVIFETPKNLGITNLKDNGAQTHKSRDINLSSGEADNSINLGVYVKPDLSKEVKNLPITSKKGFNDVLGGSALIILGILILAYRKIKTKETINNKR